MLVSSVSPVLGPQTISSVDTDQGPLNLSHTADGNIS